jgi:hypothetical protein
MKTTETFKNTISKHLESVAANDQIFAETLKKPGKNIDDCVTYILNQVKASGCNGFAAEEIFGMAIHYYDEDNIKVGKSVSCKVVVNHPVELTEEEKEKAREKAMDVAIEEAKEEAKKNLIVNVELTDEEISEAKKTAVERLVSETKEKMTTKKTVKKQDPANSQETLF